LQIFEKYKSEYRSAMKTFYAVRKEYSEKLSLIPNLRIIPSQANYILCEVLNGYKATDLTKVLLDQYNLLIKDLSTKKGFNGEYIRVAVKRPEENQQLVNALAEVLK
jgi:histidinol-phosphate/aromatic aminotransferase/cobyric acid decarboxylase-like protein